MKKGRNYGKNVIAIIAPDGNIWPNINENESHNDVAIRVYKGNKELKEKIDSILIDSNFGYMDWILMACGFLHVVIQYNKSNGEATIFLNKLEEALNSYMKKTISKIESRDDNSVNFANNLLKLKKQLPKIKKIGTVYVSDIKECINVNDLTIKLEKEDVDFKDIETEVLKRVCETFEARTRDGTKSTDFEGDR